MVIGAKNLITPLLSGRRGGTHGGLIHYLLLLFAGFDLCIIPVSPVNKIRMQHEIKHKTAELEMQALRAQMNPHFIFNSLNSINLFILENNKLQASEYLSKFSRLVRLILKTHRKHLFPWKENWKRFSYILNLNRYDLNKNLIITLLLTTKLIQPW